MGRKRTKTNEFEPKNARWLTMKIITSGGNVDQLTKAFPSLKTRGVRVEIVMTNSNVVVLKILADKPSLFTFMLKLARHSVANGIMFKAVFKDSERSLDWCGYYETNTTSAIEGSRFTNREKLENMLRTYFP